MLSERFEPRFMRVRLIIVTPPPHRTPCDLIVVLVCSPRQEQGVGPFAHVQPRHSVRSSLRSGARRDSRGPSLLPRRPRAEDLTRRPHQRGALTANQVAPSRATGPRIIRSAIDHWAVGRTLRVDGAKHRACMR